MKNKILILAIFSLIVLSGCTQNNVNAVDFDMKFNDVNEQNHTATFSVTGYPNKKEFNQIDQVIKDSMKNYDSSEEYTINVYSNEENIKKDSNPFYGTVTYQNGHITSDNLKEPSDQEYFDL